MTNTQASWDILFVHADIATMAQGNYNIIKDGAIGVAKGKIQWIGPFDRLKIDRFHSSPHPIADEIIDCSGKWILPGFVDCHTHLIWAGSRSNEFEMRLSGASYKEIAKQGGGIAATVGAVRRASEDELFSIASRRISHFISRGTTCVEIKSGYGLNLENELKMLAVAERLNQNFPLHVSPTFLGAHALPPEYKGRADDYVDLIINTMLPKVKSQGIACAMDVFCESIAFSTNQTRRLFTAATDIGLPVKLHAEQLSDSGGAALAAQFNALSCDHLEYLSPDGAKAMAHTGVTAVLLPGAFYMLKETRKPPVEDFIRLGVPMALATDLNPGTSPVHDMATVMNMGCVLFGLTCEQALAGATINGAKALGLDRRKGSLETGKDADFVVWDIEAPADLSYQVGITPVNKVVIAGKIAYNV
ncbi:imidazolonepropionase [uncultured Desulfobacter sp.]|jgi:imidazolonepropionase|uniref:imidazolonepropionase n=1 Tax=uncultured Desulfobacter sp. TaxID=240139 RepID=UPI0029C8C4EB|nr:imidazolonepropionase [uncultured Desulfobacter sp.]